MKFWFISIPTSRIHDPHRQTGRKRLGWGNCGQSFQPSIGFQRPSNGNKSSLITNVLL